MTASHIRPMKIGSVVFLVMKQLTQTTKYSSFLFWEVSAAVLEESAHKRLRSSSAEEPGSLVQSETTTAGEVVPQLSRALAADYTHALEEIERATAPAMNNPESVAQQLEFLHSSRENEIHNSERERLKWVISKGIKLVHKAPISAEEIAFRKKKKQYAQNQLIRSMADFDLDNLQAASIDYEPLRLPLEEYLKMINNVRQSRTSLHVEPVTANLPDPSVALTPFHRDIARQKTFEKRFRPHYLTGSGRNFPYFYNAEDDCFWKKLSGGPVVCVLEEELHNKFKHDPAITVAVDQTGLYDRIEEAPFPRTPQCADFYLEKATWTYYCVPDFQDLQIPKDYKKMQRYNQQINKYHFHQWAAERSQTIDLPKLYRPPKPAGSPSFMGELNFETDVATLPKNINSRLGSGKSMVQEAKAYVRGNHVKANATISPADVQYPLQEGVIVATPGNFTVAEAPSLTLVENELLVAGSKRFAKFTYDLFEV